MHLGSTSVRILPGRRASAVLALEAAPGPGNVPLEGELFLPAEWELASFELRFKREGGRAGGTLDRADMTPVAGSRSAFSGASRASRPDVTASSCPSSASWSRSTPARRAGRPRASRVPLRHVRCVDEDDGSEVAIENLRWSCGQQSAKLPAVRDEAHRCWSFRAPVGDVHVWTRNRGHEDLSTVLAAGPGTNDVELRVRRTATLQVVLRDGRKDVRLRKGALGRPGSDSRGSGRRGGPPAAASSEVPRAFRHVSFVRAWGTGFRRRRAAHAGGAGDGSR